MLFRMAVLTVSTPLHPAVLETPHFRPPAFGLAPNLFAHSSTRSCVSSCSISIWAQCYLGYSDKKFVIFDVMRHDSHTSNYAKMHRRLMSKMKFLHPIISTKVVI